jgi:Holliday junction resolvasome RuvABC endonuclease subunit
MVFVSIDPGSYCCGLVLWEQGKPTCWELVECPKAQLFEERLAHIVGEFQAFGLFYGVEAVAIEKPFVVGNCPAPELNATFRRLRQLAKQHK